MSEIKWNRQTEEKISDLPHRDYSSNLSTTRNFINKHLKEMSWLYRAYLADSQDIKESLLMFSFNPPIPIKHGRFGHPIFLHQPIQSFNIELESVHKRYQNLKANYFNVFGKEHAAYVKEREEILKQCPYNPKAIKVMLESVATQYRAA